MYVGPVLQLHSDIAKIVNVHLQEFIWIRCDSFDGNFVIDFMLGEEHLVIDVVLGDVLHCLGDGA